MLASSGVVPENWLKRSSGRRMPARPAMATRWIMALVEPPMASSVTIALSKLSARRMSRGFKSSHTMSTMRLPESVAIFAWFESGAGIDDAPGSVSPSASAIDIIVAAVPIVMHVPGERAMPSSISCQSRSVMLPARSSAQYFQVSDPEPSVWSRQWPVSIGPAGT
jgi:hypothetical protein